VKIEKTEALSRNVVGRIPGTDPTSRDLIVLGAHMDHLGHGGDGSLAPGSRAVHPGADDNASGVAAILAIARALKARPLRHDVLLVAFGAEELGIVGSARFVERSPVSLERIRAMINLDMVGRLGKGPVVLSGFGTAKEWPDVVERAAHGSGTDVATSADGFGPSDHASFYAKGVPVFFLFTKSHEDYHKPSDTWEKIDAPGLERCARFALALAREVDTLARRPTYVKVQGSPHAAGGHVATGERRARFGSVPAYPQPDGLQGVKLEGAQPGSPAEKAGIRSGDVVLEFGGRSVRTLEEYTLAIRQTKPGDKVKIVVLRDGKRVELEAALGTR
jgi:Zn-dependent M28 family amino/carboxypeptidase